LRADAGILAVVTAFLVLLVPIGWGALLAWGSGMLKVENKNVCFVDLFAGCGGLSLGLAWAGLRGAFAIEKSPDAFQTLKANFLDGPADFRFSWPAWLEQEAYSIDSLLRTHERHLRSLSGTIDVVAGGPPCQGFSYAGRRKKLDPRNRLFKSYVRFVGLVRPRLIVLENVPGMSVAHGTLERRSKRKRGRVPTSYYEKLLKALESIGYVAEGRMLDAVSFGVPQRRPRLIVIGVDASKTPNPSHEVSQIFTSVERARLAQLETLGLSTGVSAQQAISDLEIKHCSLAPYENADSKTGFFMPRYKGPVTSYQRLMHGEWVGPMDSTRLANHGDLVKKRFQLILGKYRRGVQLSGADRLELGLLKHRTIPLAPRAPAHTITTLPDDLLHYSEPRIMSVRESARLQSFPDWFVFRGKYTTGGDRRIKECPRYTQVGNAVPPLLARSIGLGILGWIKSDAEGCPTLSMPSEPRRLVAEFA
jgi:DNA (cytosine-5)-methyltransferase 1